jgi:DNA-binding SARP family transcriptional activator
MEYRVLGPFEVLDGDRAVELGGEKPRALLAILLLHRNQVVSADRLIDELWGESPPASAPRTLHVYVPRLRKALNGDGGPPVSAAGAAPASGNGVLVTTGHGYLAAGRARGA